MTSSAASDTDSARKRTPGRSGATALITAADRAGGLGAGDRLRHVPARAGADHGEAVLGGTRHGQREEAHARTIRRDGVDHGGAVAVWQVHVEQDGNGAAVINAVAPDRP